MLAQSTDNVWNVKCQTTTSLFSHNSVVYVSITKVSLQQIQAVKVHQRKNIILV